MNVADAARALAVARRIGARHREDRRRRASPLVTHAFVPLSTQSSPSRTACVRSDAASDPASGSDSANAPSISPRAIGLRNRSFCSSLPYAQDHLRRQRVVHAHAARPPTRRRPRSPRARRGTCSVSSPRPSYSSGISIPRKPSSPSLSTMATVEVRVAIPLRRRSGAISSRGELARGSLDRALFFGQRNECPGHS